MFFEQKTASEISACLVGSEMCIRDGRHREFRADAGGAKLEGPRAMADALRALRRGHVGALPDRLEAFGIKGGIKHGIIRFFQSHPPIEERIARLEQSASRSPSQGGFMPARA